MAVVNGALADELLSVDDGHCDVYTLMISFRYNFN
jgi:hypothetical protein